MQATRLREAAKEGKPMEASVLDEVAADLAAPSSEKIPEDEEEAGKWQSDTMAFISTLNTLEATAAEEQVRLVGPFHITASRLCAVRDMHACKWIGTFAGDLLLQTCSTVGCYRSVLRNMPRSWHVSLHADGDACHRFMNM
jgi:hypothetical protein